MNWRKWLNHGKATQLSSFKGKNSLTKCNKVSMKNKDKKNLPEVLKVVKEESIVCRKTSQNSLTLLHNDSLHLKNLKIKPIGLFKFQ